jgi:Holliday junction resolvasome RuvABC endonuclease subunit
MVGRLLNVRLNGAADDATDALAVAIGALAPGRPAVGSGSTR